MVESLFNKVSGLKVCSCQYCETFKNSFFYRTPTVVPSAQTSDVSPYVETQLTVKKRVKRFY